MFVPQFSSDAMFNRKNLMPVINPDKPGNNLRHPAAKAPRIFCDSAVRADIEPLLKAGIVNGITTNPSLLKKAGAKSWDHAKGIMKDLCDLLRPYPVSLELTDLDEEKMVIQASELAALGDNSVIKVPVGGYKAVNASADPYTGLKVIRRLWEKGIRTNTTLIFNTTQALWAANAGATYVSPFLGRLPEFMLKHNNKDPGKSLYDIGDVKLDNHDELIAARIIEMNAAQSGGIVDPDLERIIKLMKVKQDVKATANSEYVASGGALKDSGARLIFEIATVFANYQITTEILAASFRNPVQLTECLLAGADILTVPAPILATVADHPLSDEGMRAFVEDSRVFSA